MILQPGFYDFLNFPLYGVIADGMWCSRSCLTKKGECNYNREISEGMAATRFISGEIL